MRNLLLILTLFCISVIACEKYPEKGSAGNPLLKFYGDAFIDIGNSICETADGYLLCGKLTILERSETGGGTFIESSDEDFGLVKAGFNGNQLWSVNTGGVNPDIGRKVLPLSDGSFICVGSTTVGSGTTHRDILIAGISSTGSITWEKHYGGAGNQEGYDIVENNNGGFFITGSTNVDNPGNDNYLGHIDMLFMEINAQGDSIKIGTYGYAGDEYGIRIAKDHDNSYVVLGTTNFSDPGQGQRNMILVRINDAFGVDDNETFGGMDDEVASDIELLPDGYLVSGTVFLSEESQQGFLLRLSGHNLAGQIPLVSKRVTYEGGSVVFNSITSLPDDGFLLAGSTGSGSSADMLFKFFDINGNEYMDTFVSGGTGFQSASDAIVDAGGKIVAVGNNLVLNNSMITLLKFDPWGGN